MTFALQKPPPSHRSTTAHLQAAYPFVGHDGLGQNGPFLGRNLLGGSFCFDPWALYQRGLLTNPNLIVLGQVGRGKSTFVKTFVWRQLAFGRQAWILDPKGEYGSLASASRVVPLRLVPGGSVCLNPLDLFPVERVEDPSSRRGLDVNRPRTELVCALAASSLGRALTPAERTATDIGVRSACRSTMIPALPDVVIAMLEPDADLASEVRSDPLDLARDGRAVALELRRLVKGDLAGMFDGPTTAGIDLRAPLAVVDLSSVFASPALPLLMTCATAWMQAVLSRRDGVKRLVVLDEAWAVLHDLSTARWLQATFKLSRSLGTCNVAVVHRLSDLRAAGPEGSLQHRLAEGLLADSETRVIFGQSPSEADSTMRTLSLSRTERDAVTRLPRGVALWKVGERSFLVEHVVGRREAGLVDTDTAMRDDASQRLLKRGS